MAERGAPPRELCHDDIEINNVPEFVVQGPYRGYDDVKRWFEDAFDVFAERRLDLVEVIEGPPVITVQRVTGVSTHTGLPLDFQWGAVWRIHDGKVAAIQGYATRDQALEAAKG